jgi:alpha-amylase
MNTSEWRDESIYQIVTDRFALPDGSAPLCGLREYCGGTWKGIENKHDYIASMGFDAIWISPVPHSLEENTTWGYGYHGYHGYHGHWLDDPFNLNNHFGTAQDLRSLSNVLHERNISLMVDVVINRFAINRNPPSYSEIPKPFNDENYVPFPMRYQLHQPRLGRGPLVGA